MSLDLRAAFPEAKGFSKDNLYRMGQFYRFYSAQNEIVAQVVRQLQPTENKENTFVAQVVPQIQDTLPVNSESVPAESFPYFLGMIPWGHHIEILQSCKDVQEAVFYIEKTIQNNWSRSMLSHAIAAGFQARERQPDHRDTDMPEGQPREGGVDAGRVQQAHGRLHLYRQPDTDGRGAPRCPAGGDGHHPRGG